MEVFESQNFFLFSFKKDQCDICCGFEIKNILEEIYVKYLEMKLVVCIVKEKDKERVFVEDNLKVIVFDLQVLFFFFLLKVSFMYYKMKLGCYNFIVFDLCIKDVICYFWYEVEGDLIVNVFVLCVIDYVDNFDERIEEVIMYSDGCIY